MNSSRIGVPAPVAESAAESLIKSVRLLSKEELGMEEEAAAAAAAAAGNSSPGSHGHVVEQGAASPVSPVGESVFINAESANQVRGQVNHAENTKFYRMSRGRLTPVAIKTVSLPGSDNGLRNIQ